jgi:hypothetical protein
MEQLDRETGKDSGTDAYSRNGPIPNNYKDTKP